MSEPRHWNGKEKPVYYRPHSNWLCDKVPDDGTPHLVLDIQHAYILSVNKLISICHDHPGKHEGLCCLEEGSLD